MSITQSGLIEATPKQTFGERAVGLSFNPSASSEVDQVKKAYAAVIDLCDSIRNKTENPEVKRMVSVAITEAQTSQMWAVKASTWK